MELKLAKVADVLIMMQSSLQEMFTNPNIYYLFILIHENAQNNQKHVEYLSEKAGDRNFFLDIFLLKYY